MKIAAAYRAPDLTSSALNITRDFRVLWPVLLERLSFFLSSLFLSIYRREWRALQESELSSCCLEFYYLSLPSLVFSWPVVNLTNMHQ